MFPSSFLSHLQLSPKRERPDYPCLSNNSKTNYQAKNFFFERGAPCVSFCSTSQPHSSVGSREEHDAPGSKIQEPAQLCQLIYANAELARMPLPNLSWQTGLRAPAGVEWNFTWAEESTASSWHTEANRNPSLNKQQLSLHLQFYIQRRT